MDVNPVHMGNIKVESRELISGWKLKYWLPAFACMAVIFYASSVPGKCIPGLFKFQDIIFHFVAYLIFSFFLSRAIKNTILGISNLKLIAFTVLLVTCYGISDEFHQAFVPGRSVSGFDVLIDSLGGFFGSLVFQWRR